MDQLAYILNSNQQKLKRKKIKRFLKTAKNKPKKIYNAEAFCLGG
jgi:hypothetical protein